MTEKLAEALAIDKARREPVSVCRRCGVAARVPDPATCTVCGANDFEVVEPEVLDRIAADEGGVEEETTYDGRKLAWTQEAKKALRAIDDRYQRRRAKARIEKAAHGRRIDPITLDMAVRFIEEETGVLYKRSAAPAAAAATGKAAEPAAEKPDGTAPAPAAAEPDDLELKILARDAKNTPLLSRLDWTAEAIERVLRVPAGFMRDKTQRRIEELAAETGAARVDLALVEEGIEIGKRMMAEMLAQQATAKAEAAPAQSTAAAPGNGRHAGNGGNGSNGHPAAGNGEAAEGCPVDTAAADRPAAPRRAALNEVGVMSELDRQRRELGVGSD
jgi:hypothetical protein